MCLSQIKVTALIVQKWVWSKNFRAHYAHSYILCPHNHKHLPTPMIGYDMSWLHTLVQSLYAFYATCNQCVTYT